MAHSIKKFYQIRQQQKICEIYWREKEGEIKVLPQICLRSKKGGKKKKFIYQSRVLVVAFGIFRVASFTRFLNAKKSESCKRHLFLLGKKGAVYMNKFSDSILFWRAPKKEVPSLSPSLSRGILDRCMEKKRSVKGGREENFHTVSFNFILSFSFLFFPNPIHLIM